jgi:hypothetical protein
MSENAPEGKERRTIVSTLFDPKTFPTLIPILLAVGSAFITLDRTIQQLVIEQANIVKDVDHNHKHMLDNREGLGELKPIKQALQAHITADVERYNNLLQTQKRIERDLGKAVSAIEFMREDIKEIEEDIEKNQNK